MKMKRYMKSGVMGGVMASSLLVGGGITPLESVVAQPPSGDFFTYRPRTNTTPNHRIGGGVRSTSEMARLVALVPDSGPAATLEAQPSLYWYIANPEAVSKARLRFTLNDESNANPLVEQEIPMPTRAGIQRVNLADVGVSLTSGQVYEWFITVVVNPRQPSQNASAGSYIQRLDLPPLAAEVSALPAEQRVARLAQEGIWYDLFDALSRRVEVEEGAARWQRLRSQYLAQVGLTDIAHASSAR